MSLSLNPTYLTFLSLWTSSIYFLKLPGVGPPWHKRSIVISLSYFFPRNLLNPAIWHPHPAYNSLLPSSKAFLTSLKVSFVILCIYLELRSFSRPSFVSTTIWEILKSSSKAAPQTTPPSSIICSAIMVKMPPEELFFLISSFPNPAKHLGSLKLSE